MTGRARPVPTADPAAAAAHAVRAAVLAVPGVVRLSAGPLGEVGTYLAGERVPGVRLAPDGVHVHVVVTPDLPIPGTAAAVRTAVAAAVGDGPAVHVHVEDVDPAGHEPRGSQVPLRGTGKDA